MVMHKNTAHFALYVSAILEKVEKRGIMQSLRVEYSFVIMVRMLNFDYFDQWQYVLLPEK
jgi:hypothetical protein